MSRRSLSRWYGCWLDQGLMITEFMRASTPIYTHLDTSHGCNTVPSLFTGRTYHAYQTYVDKAQIVFHKTDYNCYYLSISSGPTFASLTVCLITRVSPRLGSGRESDHFVKSKSFSYLATDSDSDSDNRKR